MEVININKILEMSIEDLAKINLHSTPTRNTTTIEKNGLEPRLEAHSKRTEWC